MKTKIIVIVRPGPSARSPDQPQMGSPAMNCTVPGPDLAQ